MAQEKFPLMPHATATWLVDHTALSFEQISEFCGLHILEVQAMADDLASTKYTGRDPLLAGELVQEEINKAQDDPSYRMKMKAGPKQALRTKGPRYTPVSKRKDKPDGIAWILRNHPEISDAQVGKLIGTTRNTINAIRERTHWNIAEIQPKDPVTLGLCSQRELDAVVAKAAKMAGITEEEKVDSRFGGDREALIEELRAERKAASLAAEQAMDVASTDTRADVERAEEQAMLAALQSDNSGNKDDFEGADAEGADAEDADAEETLSEDGADAPAAPEGENESDSEEK